MVMSMDTIVVIGAGPAGLTCAYYLLMKKKYHVIILEESSAIGGISQTVKHNGNRMDLGGHRFFTKNDDVLKFWLDILSLQGKPALDDRLLNIQKDFRGGQADPEKNNEVMLIRNRLSRIYYKNKFFDYPVSINMKTIKNMGFLTTWKCGLSYIKSLVV